MKSVWIIQKEVNGKWYTCRDHNGLPLWYPNRREAEAKCHPLGDRYRVIQVED